MSNPRRWARAARLGGVGAGCLAGFWGCAEDAPKDPLQCVGGSAVSGGAAGIASTRGGSAGTNAMPRGGSSGAGASGGAGFGAGGGSGAGAGGPKAGAGGTAAGGAAGRAASSGTGGTVEPGTGGASGAGEGGVGESGGGAGEPGASGSSGTGSSGSGAGKGVDVFGIKQIYESAPSGAAWNSAHWSEDAYSITGRNDSHDPFGISGMRGDGSLEVTGDGELVMSGTQPRIYFYESDAGPWKNLEVTAYYQRVEDEGTAYAGLVIGVRSGPEGHTDSTACDAHTYYARVRNDGAFDFEKELEHPASSTQARVQPATAWPPDGEVPRATWIGFKFVIYDLAQPNGVKLEAYRDMTNGADGGTWTKVNETIDDGGWFVETSCAEHSPNGEGESDLVVVDGGTTFIRNTDVREARYRWVTVREITPP